MGWIPKRPGYVQAMGMFKEIQGKSSLLFKKFKNCCGSIFCWQENDFKEATNAAGKTVLLLVNLLLKANADLGLSDKATASLKASLEDAKSGESVSYLCLSLTTFCLVSINVVCPVPASTL